MLNLFEKLLFKKILIIIILLLSSQSKAGDLTIVEKGYGLRGQGGEKYEDIEFHPLLSGFSRYSTSSFQENGNSKQFNVSINISIIKKNKNVLATVSIKNAGSNTFFIREMEFPSYSLSEVHAENAISMSCGMNFFITTANIMLDYLGARCDYMGNYDKEDWIEFPPGGEHSYTTVLNDNFEFLPGNAYYNIRTTGFNLVNESWFLERSMFSYFFSALDMHSSDCHVIKNSPFVFLERYICDYHYYDENDIKHILDRFGYTGANKNNELLIRSNLVSIEIDSNNLTSIFDKE